MILRIALSLILIGLPIALPLTCQAQDQRPPDSATLTEKDLWKAVREENAGLVQTALAAGIDVNARNEYGASALMFAADRGNEEIAKILLDAGADPQVKDSFYNSTPIAWAYMKGHKNLTLAMLSKAEALTDTYLLNAIIAGDQEWATSLLAQCHPTEAGLIKARDVAMRKAKDEKFKELPQLFERYELPEYSPPPPLTPDQLESFLGKYTGGSFGAEVKRDGDDLQLGFAPESMVTLEYLGENEFNMNSAKVKFMFDGDIVSQLSISFGDNTVLLKPIGTKSETESEKEAVEANKMPKANLEDSTDAPAADPSPAAETKPKFGPSSDASLAADRAASSVNWPSFRGSGARGVAEGQLPPIEWNVDNESENNSNVKWIAPVPGLGLSSPVIWGNHLYLTSAVAEDADNQLRIGLYGDVDSVEEDHEYDFMLYCFDKNTGEQLWSQKCNSAKPAVKRHAKSSHANPSVATNGDRVVAFFSSEGLYCFTKEGKPLWKKELGHLDSGWFYDASYQWGFGSSPIIFEDRVIVQCDIQEGSFVAALDLETGDEIWKTEREEIPGWSTPTVHYFDDLPMLLTHATKAARGYDARTGELLWSMAKHSEIVVPTPFVAHNLIFIASGYSPIQPIAAIHPTARGDISLSSGQTTSDQIAWSTLRQGPYMPTPVVYGDYLYVCNNSGVLTCYWATSGKEVYRKRMTARGGGLAFTASPMAADGHLYLTAEDGRVLVVKAGPEYELVATNASGGSILATPAISEGAIFIRTENRLIAIQQSEEVKR